MAGRSNPQGFLSQYLPFGSDAPKMFFDHHDKFITPNLNHMKHGNGPDALFYSGSFTTQDFDPSKTAAKEEEEAAVQKLLATSNKTSIALSAIGVGLLTLVMLLGVRIRRALQPATALASSSTLGSGISINMAPGLSDNIMEMESQGSSINGAAAREMRHPHKETLRGVGWGQQSSQNSRPSALCYATPLGKETASFSMSQIIDMGPMLFSRGTYFAQRTQEDAARAVKRRIFGDQLSQLQIGGKRAIPDGGRVVVTGATSGVGLDVAREVAILGYEVVLCGRDEKKLERAVSLVKQVATRSVESVKFDLESLTQTRDAADSIQRADGLVLCAGCWPTTLRYTEDELEAGLQANHLGHFLLTTRLLEKNDIKRVVAVASTAHAATRQDRIELDDTLWTRRAFDPLEAYGQTKLANVLFARELPKRFNCTAVSAHPGVVNSELFRDFDIALPPDPFGLLPPQVDASIDSLAETAQSFLKGIVDSAPITPFKKPRDAARDVVVGLVSPSLDGAYLSDGERTETSPGGADDAAAAELWDWSRETIDKALAIADTERADGEWD
jgi:NAD(P)-dependent dehydrogenase (short-subunit alcohol dehydrogenase family)